MKFWKNSKSIKAIYVSGGWGYGNRGDNAILKGTLESLRREIPDARLIVTSFDQEELEKGHGLASISSIHKMFSGRSLPAFIDRLSYRAWARTGKTRLLTPRIRKVMEELRGADLVLLAGGGYFNESWLDMAQAQFATIRMASHVGTPVVICAQSIGPFSEQTRQGVLREHLALVDFIAVRDAGSLELVRSAGVPVEKSILSADEANLISPPETSSTSASTAGRLRVGLMIQNFRFHDHEAGRSAPGSISNREQYRAAIIEALRSISSQVDAEFRMIPSTTWDEGFCLDVYRALLAQGINISYVKHPAVDEFILNCQDVDIMVSTNMHPVIIAATAGKPSLALSYHYKTDKFMASVGLQDYCLRIDNFTPQELAGKFVEMARTRDALSQSVRQHHEKVKEKARTNIGTIAAMFTAAEAPPQQKAISL